MNNLTINNLMPIKTNSYYPNKLLDKSYVGIDFGTSTTIVSLSIFNKNTYKVSSYAIELNQKLLDGSIYKSYKIPTMIAWFNNKLLVGEGANRIKLKLKPGKNLWHSFKMELGQDIGCTYPQSELNNERLKILNPKDVTTIFFKYLKVQIEKYISEHNLPSQIEYAISIPASFEANQRKDLIDSLYANGIMLNKQALIDEPNAAFLSYISNSKLNSNITISKDFPTNILVFDFGAGTCDVSILEVGYSGKGFYSKNLSISRFEELGGNNIDKLIAIDVLLPQFLKENNKEKDFFKTKELSQYIIPRLEKTAELLKIQMCEKLSLLDSNNIQGNYNVISNQIITIKSRKGNFTLSSPTLSYKEFLEINNIFTNTTLETFTNRINEEIKFKSIYTPIITALKKAFLNKDDIDYVLFIGGSSKNPLIQQSIKNYFNESEHLIPQNLQSHVSAGAAIHSLLFNGFGKNIIEPITSEPIIIIINDDGMENLQTIIKAGTIIPSKTIKINNLRPHKKFQKIIEIPICVGNKNKLLHNIKIQSSNPNGFDLNTNIELNIQINADKMLLIKAIIDDKTIEVEPLNPFSNQEISSRDRKKFEAEKKFNKQCALNNGFPTQEALQDLYDAYNDLGLELKAAETLEELYEKFDAGNLNNIGLHYSNAGYEDKAMMFYEKAMQKHPSATTAFNIAIEYRYKNRELYIKWIKKAMEINPNYILAYYCYGKILIEDDKEEKGYKLVNKAFNNWKNEYETGYLSCHISWFISCARFLNEYDYAKQLEDENKNLNEYNDSYNLENLTSLKMSKKIMEK